MNSNTASFLLKDLKVIELSNILAGPAVGMFFAELGADVLKIENTLTNGDLTRGWKLPSENPDKKTSAYYHSVNWNKKIIFLDLTKEDDRKKAYEEIKDADIIISNFKAGDDLKLGMDHETIKKINPNIIYAAISSFPDDERPAFDVVLQAETGFMSMNGTPETGPVKMPVALIDILAAHQLKEAILLSLLNKQKTGKGAYVSVSLYEAAIASLANQASNWLNAQHIPIPIGSLHPNIAPYGEIFFTKDKKQIVLAVGNDKQFKNLCAILNKPKTSTESRFETNQQRVKNRSYLYNELKVPFSEMKSEYLMEEFKKENIPAGIIKNIKEVFEEKSAQNMILEQTEKEDGTTSKRVKTAAFKINF